jgi:hypothetical protein
VCGPALAGVQNGFSRFGLFQETGADWPFAASRPALARSGNFANSSSLVAEIGQFGAIFFDFRNLWWKSQHESKSVATKSC